MIKGEEGFISAILTQAVEDAKYTGFNKHDIKLDLIITEKQK